MPLKAHWYRLVFAVILLLPALICQTVLPVIPYQQWERFAEVVYAKLLRFQRPDADGPASRVVVIEVDQKTLDAYGWPVDRSYYVTLLEKLKNAGHPWVLSLLQFQSLEKLKASSETKEERSAKDLTMANAIKAYDRYVGSGLDIEDGAELTGDQEELLLPRIMLTKSGTLPESLPYLPLNMVEDDRFVEAQRAFGFGTRFGTESVINCMQFYVTDAQHKGSFVIPSSLVWVASLANGAGFQTNSGVTWRGTGSSGVMPIGFKQCLESPSVTTAEFFASRRIQRLSLADALEASDLDLKDKVIILARGDMRRFRGPGIEDAEGEAVVEEHLLAARFLDGMLTGNIIQREDLARFFATKWLPLAAAGTLSLASLFLSTVGIIGIAGAAFCAITAFSAYQLFHGVFLIPMQMMTSVAATATLLAFLFAYLRYYGIRRQIRFATRLREALSQCNTLADVEAKTFGCAQDEFDNASLRFGDYDHESYEATSDAKAAIALLDKRERQDHTGSLAVTAITESQFGPSQEGEATRLTRVGRPNGITRMHFRARGMNVEVKVESKLGRLGTIRLGVSYLPHEESFINNLIDVLRIEVTQTWHRVKLLVDQKLLDYKFLMERTRGDIMERFLTHVLVSKFEDGLTMEQNLKVVLTPRQTRAALFQADIRGYSRVSAKMEPLAMVRLLQGYFSNVVDAAQMVAQVKLIGDCIFFFIEDEACRPGISPTDLALELASVLVSETMRQNDLRRAELGEELNFGIAIHYGDVVVGNLSSDSCIDYTVIGPNVNLVARLEEITKNPNVARAIGTNGVIISEEAFLALEKHKGRKFTSLVLEDLSVAVRSFPHVKTVKGLPATSALAVTPDAVIQLPKPKIAS